MNTLRRQGIPLFIAVITGCVCMFMLMFVPVSVGASAQESADDSADVLFEIVDFVVSRDLVLKAQQDVIDAAQKLDAGSAESSAVVPEYARNRIVEAELERAIRAQEAQERYMALKRQLVSDLLKRITDMSNLGNKIENQMELHSLLQQRQSEVERQVQAGILEPLVLWQLSEKIIVAQTTIADARDQLEILRRETAFSYGGQEWRDLLRLLERLDNTL